MKRFVSCMLNAMEMYQAQVGNGSVQNPNELIKFNSTFTAWIENLREVEAAIPALNEIEETTKLLSQLAEMLKAKMKSINISCQIGKLMTGIDLAHDADVKETLADMQKDFDTIEKLRVAFCKFAVVLQPVESTL